MRFISGPWSIFRRMRIICGGTIIEDVDNYNRCHDIFHLLSSKASRENLSVMGFNSNSYNVVDTRDRNFPISLEQKDYIGLVSSKTVMFKLLSGLCNCDKYLPLRYMGGLTIELELVSDPLDPLISDTFTAPAVAAWEGNASNPPTLARAAVPLLQESNISRDWGNF